MKENNLITVANNAEMTELLRGILFGRIHKKYGFSNEYESIICGSMNLLLDMGRISQQDYDMLKNGQKQLVNFILDRLGEGITSLAIGEKKFLRMDWVLSSIENINE